MEKLNALAVQMIEDKKFLLKKHETLKQITSTFYDLAKNTKPDLKKIFKEQAKVSRGENLKGLPYLVLDYPRVFSEVDVFAFRTLFWWGNYISFTLHLKGKYLKEDYPEELLKSNKLNDALLSFSGEEWNHDLNSDNYTPYYNLNFEKLDISTLPFLKISFRLDLDGINSIAKNYKSIREILLAPFYGNKL